ncbi:proteasomal ubiquitin receptor ADRM1 homolog [Drosophila eugracilis]|uniref:proteasomal ubiquitin receptor ADRM1 homolog n=1 Tax=Drosophila eugracilis TaxID=29029 RepID=UPI0007E71732|nr:proteasomal ubiquitin receptor ADRM1 homolog [Drosophila eugracilis]
MSKDTPISTNLAEHKAGRMTLIGKMVEPDERRGLLFARRSTTDNQVHIHWMDTRSGAIELDIIVTPGGLEFRRIDECKTGRVYVLKYTRSTQRYFFWMQEPKMEKDMEFCQRLNEIIGGGPKKYNESEAAEGDVDTDVEQDNHRGFGGSELIIINHNESSQELLENSILLQTDDSDETLSLTFSNIYTYSEPKVLASAIVSHGTEAMECLMTSSVRRQKLLAQLPKDPDEEDNDNETEIIFKHLRSDEFKEFLTDFTFGLHAGVLNTALKSLIKNHEVLEAAQSGDIERFIYVLTHQA